jgi:hypothetical protein
MQGLPAVDAVAQVQHWSQRRHLQGVQQASSKHYMQAGMQNHTNYWFISAQLHHLVG